MRDVSTTGGYVPFSILKYGDKEKICMKRTATLTKEIL